MKKLGKYGKKVSCVVIGMLCAAAIGACGSTQSGSQDEKDVRNDISVYEEGADLEGTLTYGTLFIEPQTQHMIDLFMKEHPGVKIETKVVFDNDVTEMIITIISCEQQKSMENCIKFRKVFIMLCFG